MAFVEEQSNHPLVKEELEQIREENNRDALCNFIEPDTANKMNHSEREHVPEEDQDDSDYDASGAHDEN